MVNNPSRQTTLTDIGSTDTFTLEEIDWTFKNADTQYVTHGFHQYPARMIPQIPDTVFQYFVQENVISSGDVVWDPFSGSGTTSVEARRHNLNAIAHDLNPFACMLTLAKADPVDPSLISQAKSELYDGLEEKLQRIETKHSDGELKEVDVGVRDGWFPEPQLHQLVCLKSEIDELQVADTDTVNDAVQRFFRIILSHTTRKVSYQRNSEFKRYRMPEEKRDTHSPDVWDIFTTKLRENYNALQDYYSAVDTSLETTVHYADSRYADSSLEDNSVDIVVTSPPYGDHSTTVAYGEFSQDPAIISQGREYDEMRSVDKNGLGGTSTDPPKLPELQSYSPTLQKTVEILEGKDGRSEDAIDFFVDYYLVLQQVQKILKDGQPAVFVVANRTMSRVNIPTHLITIELCQELGFTHGYTLPREIPNKTLPFENAPENVQGETGDMMAEENIVIMWNEE